MQCSFCKKKLGLFRSVMGEQFCSEDHEFLYKRQQHQIFAERLLDGGAGQLLLDDSGPDLSLGAADSVVLFPEACEETSESLRALSSAAAAAWLQNPVDLPDSVEGAFAIEKPLPRRPSRAAPRARIDPDFSEISSSPRIDFAGPSDVIGRKVPLITDCPYYGGSSPSGLHSSLGMETPAGQVSLPRLALGLGDEVESIEPEPNPSDDPDRPAAAQAIRIEPRGIFAPRMDNVICPEPLRSRSFSWPAVRPSRAAFTFTLARGALRTSEHRVIGDVAVLSIGRCEPLSAAIPLPDVSSPARAPITVPRQAGKPLQFWGIQDFREVSFAGVKPRRIRAVSPRLRIVGKAGSPLFPPLVRRWRVLAVHSAVNTTHGMSGAASQSRWEALLNPCPFRIAIPAASLAAAATFDRPLGAFKETPADLIESEPPLFDLGEPLLRTASARRGNRVLDRAECFGISPGARRDCSPASSAAGPHRIPKLAASISVYPRFRFLNGYFGRHNQGAPISRTAWRPINIDIGEKAVPKSVFRRNICFRTHDSSVKKIAHSADL